MPLSCTLRQGIDKFGSYAYNFMQTHNLFVRGDPGARCCYRVQTDGDGWGVESLILLPPHLDLNILPGGDI